MKPWIIFLCLCPVIALGESIWIEGEDAAESEVTRHGWYNGVKKDGLSGGDWLSHFNEAKPGTASYPVTPGAAGEFTFWVRANPVKSELSYRLNGGDWIGIDLASAPRGQMNIAADNKPDLRFIAWAKVGQITLKDGANELEFRMTSGPQNHGGIDCFCLSNDAWVPSGILKPGKLDPAGPADWFPIIADTDPLSPESFTDISHLIEAPAGQHGFLKCDREHLRFEKAGSPSKFWAVGVGSMPVGKTEAQMEQAARWYRKHGINLVRQHTMMGTVGLLNEAGEFNPEKLAAYDRWFAHLKAQGIYSTWSVVYPHHGAFLRKNDGIDPALFAELDAADTRHDGSRGPIVANDFINLDPEIQAVAWRYFQKLLDHENPHTGLRYRDDPALAVVEFQNESNVFFHTLNDLRTGKKYPRYSEKMRKAFFAFVEKKYRTMEGAAEAWGGKWDRFDDWEAGELGLMGAFHWGSEGPLHEFAGQHRRAGDYIEFLAGIQRDYYTHRESELRAAGFKGVTVATAWKSGGAGASMANLYADTAADMVDRHNYFGGGAGGHAIVPGEVSNATHLDKPGRGLLALGLFQVADRPFGVSEWSMMPPAPYKAEAAPLIAFYGLGLQGWDASYHFSAGTELLGDGWPNLSKYVTTTPHYMGQFPALALAVHEGHLREGPAVAQRVLAEEDVFSGRDALGQALSGGSHDLKTLTGNPATPPEVLAIGRVTLAFGNGETKGADLSRHWDQENLVLRAATGELIWDYKSRIVQVRAPKSHAVIGFAGGRKLDWPGLSVEIETPFVSLLFTSLDGEPITDSKKILVTAMAREKQSGAEFNEDWSELRTVGSPPLLMEPVQAKITVKGSIPTRIRPLDVHGVPRPGSNLEVAADGSFRIDGTHRSYYYLIER